jgi:hypothetical protein
LSPLDTKFQRAGLKVHFVMVENIKAAIHLYSIMAKVEAKPAPLGIKPRASTFMVDGEKVQYGTPAGNLFYIVVKDVMEEEAKRRLGKDLERAGVDSNWVFDPKEDPRAKKAHIQALSEERLGYYSDRKKASVSEKEPPHKKTRTDTDDNEEEDDESDDEP